MIQHPTTRDPRSPPQQDAQQLQENERVLKAQKGDPVARDQVLVNHLPLIRRVAQKHTGYGTNIDDLVQEGSLGLLRAIDRFDAGKGRFVSYALWWIRAYMIAWLRENRSQVRRGKREVTWVSDLSLDAPLRDRSDKASGIDRMVDDSPDPEERYLTKEVEHEVRLAMQPLEPCIGKIGWDILKKRTTQQDPVTLKELGAHWGISAERVRQLELQTRRLLQRRLDSLGHEFGFLAAS